MILPSILWPGPSTPLAFHPVIGGIVRMAYKGQCQTPIHSAAGIKLCHP